MTRQPLTFGVVEPCGLCSHRRDDHPGDGPCMVAVAGGGSICPCSMFTILGDRDARRA